MVKPYFSPEISLGNLIQVISLITMIGGGAITSYVSLRSDIAANGERSGKAIADVNARVLVLEARREIDERFQQARYRQLFPEWWRTRTIRTTSEINSSASQFWEQR